MYNKNLSKEQKIIRNILYGILALTIFISCIVDFYSLIDQKYRYLINSFMIGIFGIVNYIGYKYQLINKSSTISAIIIVAIIVAIRLLNR